MNIEEKKLLHEYTEAVRTYDKAWAKKMQLQRDIEATLKTVSQRLRVAMRKAIRKQSQWVIEKAHVWPLLNHANRPITGTAQVHMEFARYGKPCVIKIDIRTDPSHQDMMISALKDAVQAFENHINQA